MDGEAAIDSIALPADFPAKCIAEPFGGGVRVRNGDVDVFKLGGHFSVLLLGSRVS